MCANEDEFKYRQTTLFLGSYIEHLLCINKGFPPNNGRRHQMLLQKAIFFAFVNKNLSVRFKSEYLSFVWVRVGFVTKNLIIAKGPC